MDEQSIRHKHLKHAAYKKQAVHYEGFTEKNSCLGIVKDDWTLVTILTVVSQKSK